MKYNTSYSNLSKKRIQELAGYIQECNSIPKVKALDDAIVLPRKVKGLHHNINIPYQGLGGVVDSNGELVEESVIYDLKVNRDEERIAFGGAYSVNLVEQSDQIAIYLGLAHKHWGHFLIDIVQRCWYPMIKGLLKEKKGQQHSYQDNIDIPPNFLFVFSGFGDKSTKFSGNYEEFFRLLGLETDRIIFVNKPTKYKKVIVPDIAVYPGEYITSVYKKLYEIIIEQAMHEAKGLQIEEKIYFSRSHLNNSKDMGEKGIECVMALCKFKIMYPEELSLIEQIFYWQTASNIACINGTNPHNCVFSHKNILLFVFNKMEQMVGYQFTMDAVQEVTPVYISAYYEPFNRYPISVSRGPFWIMVTNEVKDFIKEQFNEDVSISKKTLNNWIRYLKLCIIIEIKYRLRGRMAKIKKLIRIFSKLK